MEEFTNLVAQFGSHIPAWVDLELIIRVAVQVLLLTVSAFFSGSETALFSLTSFDLQRLQNSQHPRWKSIQEMLDEPRRLIISLLCGNELVNIASAANMAAILLKYFTEDQTTWINIVVMVPMLLLFGARVRHFPRAKRINGASMLSKTTR